MLRVLFRRLLRHGMAVLIGFPVLRAPSLAKPGGSMGQTTLRTQYRQRISELVARGGAPGGGAATAPELRNKHLPQRGDRSKQRQHRRRGRGPCNSKSTTGPYRSPELGLGPHVVVQLDQQEPQRIFSSDSKGLINVAIDDLDARQPSVQRLCRSAPGEKQFQHRDAGVHGSSWTSGKNCRAQPDLDAPNWWRSHRSRRAAGALLPINWFLFNAPLQNLRDGDGSWRLRISIDGRQCGA